MKQKTSIDLTLGFFLVVGLLLFFIMVTSDDANATWKDRQEQDQEQGQSQLQTQDQTARADASASASQTQGNEQSIAFNAPKSTGRSFVSSGDATADCQKFAGLSSGWLGGALGLGLNFTDKDCRLLLIYDRLVVQGHATAANRVLCKTKAMGQVYGKNSGDACFTELSALFAEIEVESSAQTTQAPPDTPAPYTEYERKDGETASLERRFTAAECDEREQRKDLACSGGK